MEVNKKIITSVLPEELPPILTVRHVSSFLGLHKNGAYALFKRQGFPSIFFGKKMIVPRDAFLRWIENEAAKPVEEKMAL